ncbi:MAG TPA: 4-alpha-glucanotransferase, partial [Oligoflexia bacterium]|nr:4-alpha-glucanotransferase [Oligoflexia bacterium]
PVSRLAINHLYIDLAEAARMLGAQELQVKAEQPQFTELASKLRNKKTVTYAEIAALKFGFLEELFADFEARHLAQNTAFAADFAEFVTSRGEELERFASYCVLHERFAKPGPPVEDWSKWPVEYHDCRLPAVFATCTNEPHRIVFYKFVQWLAHGQLAAVREHCRRCGLAVGLYLDVALGAAGGGADVWVNKDLYAFGVSMGAPPDRLAPQGQDWGLPPLVPHRLREARYAPFIAMLRASMQYAGALRIDHVMSLMRLYWVPGPGEAKNGAYVRYNLEELVAILAIESQRHQCIVIGEDLGTVPNEVRDAMAQRGILSYKVLYFMKDYQRGEFFRAVDYPPLALVVTSTHDLPTLKGYWAGHDLAVRRALRLHDKAILDELAAERAQDREALLRLMADEGYIAADDAANPLLLTRAIRPEMVQHLHCFLARTASVMQVVQLEDLIAEKEQANLPGTTTEHANWQ